MRTTVTLDDDVAAAAQLRTVDRIGLSEAVNRLARAGLARIQQSGNRTPFVQRTHDLELLIDVTNVAEALELLDEPR